MTDTLRTKAALKLFFEDGDVPSGSQFDDLVTTMVAEGGSDGTKNGSVQIGQTVAANGTAGCFALGSTATANTSQGSFALGDTVTAVIKGSFAQGHGVIANGVGSFAQGSSSTVLGDFGAFAQGRNVTISAAASKAYGVFVQGDNAQAQGNRGSFAQGLNATAVGDLGTFAQGASVTAIGDSSFAQGSSSTALVNNSAIFFSGSNDEVSTLKVGGTKPVRLCAGGEPTTPVNGDIWVDAIDNVIIYSGGFPITIS